MAVTKDSAIDAMSGVILRFIFRKRKLPEIIVVGTEVWEALYNGRPLVCYGIRVTCDKSMRGNEVVCGWLM